MENKENKILYDKIRTTVIAKVRGTGKGWITIESQDLPGSHALVNYSKHLGDDVMVHPNKTYAFKGDISCYFSKKHNRAKLIFDIIEKPTCLDG